MYIYIRETALKYSISRVARTVVRYSHRHREKHRRVERLVAVETRHRAGRPWLYEWPVPAGSVGRGKFFNPARSNEFFINHAHDILDGPAAKRESALRYGGKLPDGVCVGNVQLQPLGAALYRQLYAAPSTKRL